MTASHYLIFLFFSITRKLFKESALNVNLDLQYNNQFFSSLIVAHIPKFLGCYLWHYKYFKILLLSHSHPPLASHKQLIWDVLKRNYPRDSSPEIVVAKAKVPHDLSTIHSRAVRLKWASAPSCINHIFPPTTKGKSSYKTSRMSSRNCLDVTPLSWGER